MKSAFAIFFSALLLMGQTAAFRAETLAQSQLECAKCDCGGKCCVSQSRPAPRQAPVAPAQNVSLKQSQFTAVSAAQVYLLPELPAPFVSFACPSHLKSEAVPLYEWNCAYLI
jgi:hypothetical protein